MRLFSLITARRETLLTTHVGGKTSNIIYTQRAINALTKRKRPLLIENEALSSQAGSHRLHKW